MGSTEGNYETNDNEDTNTDEGGVKYMYSDDVYSNDSLMVMEEHVDDDKWKQTLMRRMEENIDETGEREH